MLLLSDKLMSGCAAGTNECLNLRGHAFSPNGQVNAEWSRCPGSMARRARDSVAPLRQSSTGWMPARIGRLSAGIARRHPVTVRKASLMAGLVRRVWELRQHTGARYSAVECTRAKVAVRNVGAPTPQSELASRLRSAMRDVSNLQSHSGCRRYVSDRSRSVQGYSEVFGFGTEAQAFIFVVDFQLTFSFLVVKMQSCRHRFCSAEL